ncbi:MAG: hypothetical protein AAGN46_15700, partial [Acidobacteriota bacterium]
MSLTQPSEDDAARLATAAPPEARRWPASRRRGGVYRQQRSAASKVSRAAVIGLILLALAALVFGLLQFRPETAAPPSFEGRVAIGPFAVGDRDDTWMRWGLPALIDEQLRATASVDVVASDRLRDVLSRRMPIEPKDVQKLAAGLGARVHVDATLRRDEGAVVADVIFRDLVGDRSAERSYRGERPLQVAEALAQAIGDAVGGGVRTPTQARVFSGDPFVDRMYAAGVARLLGEGSSADRWATARPYLEIAAQESPRFLQARARLAEASWQAGDAARARALVLDLTQAAQARASLDLQGRGFELLARLDAADGDEISAEQSLRQADRLYGLRADRAARARVAETSARLARANGRSDDAEEALLAAAELYASVGDRLARLDVLLDLGSARMVDGQLEDATEVLEEALTVADGLEDARARGRAAASLAEVALRRGDTDRAAELWQRALDLSSVEEPARRLRLTGRLAPLEEQRGALAVAETLYGDQLELAAALGDRRAEAEASLALARLALRQGYPSQARKLLDRTLTLDTYLDDRVELQKIIAWMAYERGNWARASDASASA